MTWRLVGPEMTAKYGEEHVPVACWQTTQRGSERFYRVKFMYQCVRVLQHSLVINWVELWVPRWPSSSPLMVAVYC